MGGNVVGLPIDLLDMTLLWAAMATKINIQFFDKHLQPTQDSFEGSPTVVVDVDGGRQVLQNERALIDTGCNVTCINDVLIAGLGLVPVGSTDIKTVGLQGRTDVYRATLSIDGLNDPVAMEVVARNTRDPVLIGRDLLQRYCMVYDPPTGEFTLTKP